MLVAEATEAVGSGEAGSGAVGWVAEREPETSAVVATAAADSVEAGSGEADSGAVGSVAEREPETSVAVAMEAAMEAPRVAVMPVVVDVDAGS